MDSEQGVVVEMSDWKARLVAEEAARLRGELDDFEARLARLAEFIREFVG